MPLPGVQRNAWSPEDVLELPTTTDPSAEVAIAWLAIPFGGAPRSPGRPSRRLPSSGTRLRMWVLSRRVQVRRRIPPPPNRQPTRLAQCCSRLAGEGRAPPSRRLPSSGTHIVMFPPPPSHHSKRRTHRHHRR